MPSRYRDELLARAAGQMVLTVDLVEPCLCLYPLDAWEQVEAQLRNLPSLSRQARLLQRQLIGKAEDLELDGNGRLLLPQSLREHAQLDKKVVLVGQLNKFQLWNEDAWAAVNAADLEQIQQPGVLPDELLGLIL